MCIYFFYFTTTCQPRNINGPPICASWHWCPWFAENNELKDPPPPATSLYWPCDTRDNTFQITIHCIHTDAFRDIKYLKDLTHIALIFTRLYSVSTSLNKVLWDCWVSAPSCPLFFQEALRKQPGDRVQTGSLLITLTAAVE